MEEGKINFNLKNRQECKEYFDRGVIRLAVPSICQSIGYTGEECEMSTESFLNNLEGAK